MKKLFFLLTLWAALIPGSLPSQAQRIKADLDGDGKMESIEFGPPSKRSKDAKDEFMEMRVLDSQGRAVWTSPPTSDSRNPMAFGRWQWGSSLPELAGDIDGDRYPELIVPIIRYDGGPTFFRIFRWDGRQFRFVRESALILDRSEFGALPWMTRADSFRWQNQLPRFGAWVTRLTPRTDGAWLAAVTEICADGRQALGTAVLVPARGVLAVQNWVRPLDNNRPPVGPPPPHHHHDPDVVVCYRARLSHQDHFNSKGERVKGAATILRQDRANFHKGIRDPEDEFENYFADDDRRAKLTTLPLKIGDTLKNMIENGTPLIEVEVTKFEIRAKLVAPNNPYMPYSDPYQRPPGNSDLGRFRYQKN